MSLNAPEAVRLRASRGYAEYVEYAIRFLRYGAIRNSNSVTQLFWNTRFNGKY
jgi:hypothetical protein